MKVDEMNLEQITARLAELDEEVRAALTAEVVEKAAGEKPNLSSEKQNWKTLNGKQTAFGKRYYYAQNC